MEKAQKDVMVLKPYPLINFDFEIIKWKFI